MTDTPNTPPAGDEPELDKELEKAGKNIQEIINEKYESYVPKLVFGALLLLFFGWIFKLIGLNFMNLILSILLGASGIVLFLNPAFLEAITGLGALSGALKVPETIAQEVPEALKKYARFAAAACFWFSAVFLTLWQFSIDENPWGLWPVVAAGMVIVFYTIWKKKKPWVVAWAMYALAILIVIYNLLACIPSRTWVRITGHDVKGFFSGTAAETGVDTFEAAQRAQDEKAKEIFMAEMTRRAKRGIRLEDMPKDDQVLYQKIKQERDDRSLPNALSKMFEHREAQAAPTKPEPPPPPPPPMRVADLPVPTPPPPAPPPVAAPKPLPRPEHKVPDWKVTEWGSVYGRSQNPRVTRSEVKFSADREKVTLRRQDGYWFVFKGVRVGERTYRGTWQQENPYNRDYYWGEFEIEFADDWESAESWRTIQNNPTKIRSTWEHIPRL
jgi:hypothetical protein